MSTDNSTMEVVPMILTNFTKSAFLLGLFTILPLSPIMADDFLVTVAPVSPEEQVETLAKVSNVLGKASSAVFSTLAAVPGQCAGAAYSVASSVAAIPGKCAGLVYQETLGKHPGKCMLLMGATFCAYLAKQEYNKWHTARATTRRTIGDKIQTAYNAFKAYGNTAWDDVHNVQRNSVVQKLGQIKAEVLNDAQRVYNWGMLQDTKLVYLIEEFFAVLAKKTSGNALPAAAAPAAQPYWFQFWKHGQPAERQLDDILVDIKNCLYGAS